jgi:DNA-binding transcriptional regulator YiaG
MSDDNQFASQIRNLRYKLRMSQEEFASYLGVSAKTIHRWETSKSIPNDLAIATIQQLAKQNKFYTVSNAIATTSQVIRYKHPKNTDIVNLRLSLRMSQAEFAEILGVHLKTIQRWERGHTKPSLFYLKKIIEIKESHQIHSMRLIRV